MCAEGRHRIRKGLEAGHTDGIRNRPVRRRLGMREQDSTDPTDNDSTDSSYHA